MQCTIVCDQADEAALLTFVLKRASIDARTAPNLDQAMAQLLQAPPDLLLLAARADAVTPLVRRVRRDSEVCLAVLPSRWDEDDVCDALEAGADAVYARPYSARVLVGQLRALLRRSRGTSLSVLPSFVLGALTLDPSTRIVHVEGHASRRLTQLEFRLLYVLMLHHGQTVPADVIVERVWGYDADAGTELVRGLVRRLRSKIEPDPRRPRYVITEPALGYRLEATEEDGFENPVGS